MAVSLISVANRILSKEIAMSQDEWSQLLQTDMDKLFTDREQDKREQITLKNGERRNVTVLFLDIKGFTAMSEKLDPEEVAQIIDNVFKVLTSEILRYGGIVDKYIGDCIMALFGAKKPARTTPSAQSAPRWVCWARWSMSTRS